MTTATAPARRVEVEDGGDDVDRLLSSIDMGPAVPRDIIQMKMENEQLFAEARLHKRDHKKLLADIQEQLTTYRSFALNAMYSKPVGKDEHGKKKIARGLSIRAAEAIQCALGCNRLSVNLTPLDKWQVLVSVTFTDFLNLTTQTRPEIVSRKYTGWKYVNGRKTNEREEKTIEESRFNATVVKAAISRCAREAITKSCPPGLRSEMEVLAKNAAKLYMDDDTFNKIVKSFGERGVAMAALEKYLEKRSDNWSVNDRVELATLWNGIESGDADPATVGNDDEPEVRTQAPTPTATAPKSNLSDLRANIRENWAKLGGEKAEAAMTPLGFPTLKKVAECEVAATLNTINEALASAVAAEIVAKHKAAKEAKVEAQAPGVPIAQDASGATSADPTGGDEVCSKSLMGEIKKAASALTDDKRHAVYSQFKIRGLLPVESWKASDARDLLQALKDAK